MTNIQAEFARAVFELAKEDGRCDQVHEQLHLVDQVLKENPDYQKLLDTPAVPTKEKLALIDSAFSPVSAENIVSLLKILTERRQSYLFSSVVSAYDTLYDEARGILRVEAISAVPLSDAQRDALSKKVAQTTGKHIVLTNSVKPEILGGVLLRWGGVQLDGTLKARLDTLEESLCRVIVK